MRNTNDDGDAELKTKCGAGYFVPIYSECPICGAPPTGLCRLIFNDGIDPIDESARQHIEQSERE